MIESAELKAIFPIGLGVFKRTVPITSEELKIVTDSIAIKNTYNLSGNDYNLLNRPELKNIREFCSMCADVYYNTMMGYKSKVEITESWSNETKPGQRHHSHQHKNSIISGVFYLSDTNESAIEFLSPTRSISTIGDHIPSENIHDFNTNTMLVATPPNTCVVFPSWLEHQVQINNSNESRYSIAFNTFFSQGQSIGIPTARLSL
jgi:hypothetical protein